MVNLKSIKVCSNGPSLYTQKMKQNWDLPEMKRWVQPEVLCRNLAKQVNNETLTVCCKNGGRSGRDHGSMGDGGGGDGSSGCGSGRLLPLPLSLSPSFISSSSSSSLLLSLPLSWTSSWHSM